MIIWSSHVVFEIKWESFKIPKFKGYVLIHFSEIWTTISSHKEQRLKLYMRTTEPSTWDFWTLVMWSHIRVLGNIALRYICHFGDAQDKVYNIKEYHYVYTYPCSHMQNNVQHFRIIFCIMIVSTTRNLYVMIKTLITNMRSMSFYLRNYL